MRLSTFVGRHHEAGKPAMPGGPPQVSHRVFGGLVAEKLQVGIHNFKFLLVRVFVSVFAFSSQRPSALLRGNRSRLELLCHANAPSLAKLFSDSAISKLSHVNEVSPSSQWQ